MDLFKSGKALPLAFHVDYWDNLGWKDPFSSALFTARQAMYANALGDSSLYTPEMVVDGGVGFVGSDLARAQKETAVPASPPASVAFVYRLTPRGMAVKTTVSFPHTADPGLSPKIDVVIFENGLSTDVLVGENRGRNLTENFVVRNLEELEPSKNNGDFTGKAVVPLDTNWVQSHLGVAVFAQDQTTRKILGLRWVYPVSGQSITGPAVDSLSTREPTEGPLHEWFRVFLDAITMGDDKLVEVPRKQFFKRLPCGLSVDE
jgi:hypothetical protein